MLNEKISSYDLQSTSSAYNQGPGTSQGIRNTITVSRMSGDRSKLRHEIFGICRNDFEANHPERYVVVNYNIRGYYLVDRSKTRYTEKPMRVGLFNNPNIHEAIQNGFLYPGELEKVSQSIGASMLIAENEYTNELLQAAHILHQKIIGRFNGVDKVAHLINGSDYPKLLEAIQIVKKHSNKSIIDAINDEPEIKWK